jgi:hypothetical protein
MSDAFSKVEMITGVAHRGRPTFSLFTRNPFLRLSSVLTQQLGVTGGLAPV